MRTPVAGAENPSAVLSSEPTRRARQNLTKSMRIGLDGQPLVRPKTGVGHYTLELARALATLRPDDSFELIAPDTIPASIIRETETIPNLRIVSVKANVLMRRWSSIGLPRYIRRARLDLFHGTNYQLPLMNAKRNVLTVHDLSVFTHPDTHDVRFARRARRRLPIMLGAASHVITPTEAIKDEVTARFNLDPLRITVTPEAPRNSFFQMRREDTAAVRQRLGIENDFILFVGTIEPRKNLQTLLRAFERISRMRDRRLQLVLAGAEGWLPDDFDRLVRASEFRERIRLTGYLSDEELRALYSSCKVFVYPSLYEGFGLPPLEAMACGAPVVASRIAAHEETLKDKARLVEPLDELALAKVFVEFLEDEKARKSLAEAGLAYVANFSWRKTAEVTWGVYEGLFTKSFHSHSFQRGDREPQKIV
jgi:glycosyltransferase involved in cell wall biosynthesis